MLALDLIVFLSSAPAELVHLAGCQFVLQSWSRTDIASSLSTLQVAAATMTPSVIPLEGHQSPIMNDMHVVPVNNFLSCRQSPARKFPWNDTQAGPNPIKYVGMSHILQVL